MFTVGPTLFAKSHIPAGFLEDSLGYYTFTLEAALPLATAKSTSILYSGGSALFANGRPNAYASSTTLDGTFDTSRLNVGTGDFTIEAQVYPTSFSGVMSIFLTSQHPSAYQPVINLAVHPTGQLRFFAFGGVGLDFLSSNTLNLNAWNSVGLRRSATTWTLYVNGVSTTTTSSQDLTSVIPQVVVGYYWYGYIDHLRMSRIARAIGVTPGFYDVADPDAVLILEFDDT
jgi:hypothetical protein